MGMCYSAKCMKTEKTKNSVNQTIQEKTQNRKNELSFSNKQDIGKNEKEIDAKNIDNCYLEIDNEDLLYQDRIIKEVSYLEKEKLKSDISSLDELLQYFKTLQSEKKEIELIYLAYLWVTTNIVFKYNVLADLESVNIEYIFKTRQASSKGINLLFCSILENCNIQVLKVKGTYKTVDFTVEFKSGAIVNHEWAAVSYEGKYNLVDCVLGSGFFYEELKLIKSWNNFYFFTSPMIIIYSHFPDNPSHAFLNVDQTLLTIEAFYLMPNLNQFYFKNHLHIIFTENAEEIGPFFHPKNDFKFISENNELIMCFGIKEDVNVLTTLKKIEDTNDELEELTMINLKDSSHNSYFYNHCKTVNHSNNIKLNEVILRVPSKGEFLLNIYLSNNDLTINNERETIFRSRKKQNEDEIVPLYYFAFSFFINLSDISIEEKELNELKFPLFNNIYYEKKCELIEPLYYDVKRLLKNKQLLVRIRIPNCILAGIFLDETGTEFLQMERKENDIFSILVKEDSFSNEKFFIVASFSNSEEDILTYLVEYAYII